MPVAVPCASCNTALEIDLEHVGWRVRCPKCDSVFVARSSAMAPAGAGGGAPPSPFAQTWTPPGGWAGGTASPPPSLSGAVAPGAAHVVESPTPPTMPGTIPQAPFVQPSLAQPTGSFNEIFSPPIPSLPGAGILPQARTAFVLGVLSIACFHLLTGIPAVLIGYKARHKIRSSGGHLAGDNLALAGIVMGAIGIVLTLTDGWTPWSLVRVFNDRPRVHSDSGDTKHK